jgi:NAD-dependent deacetylase
MSTVHGVEPIAAAVDALEGRTRILVFTGAGISTESGIPDFRGPDGVWTRVDPAEFTYRRYVERAETRIASWRQRHESHVLDAVPNRAHDALVDLWQSTLMIGCVTQNIDGLHQRAGLPDDAVVELHGNARQTVCLECSDTTDTMAVLERVAGGDPDPRCLQCGGILKVGVVFFGEDMPIAELARSHDMAEEADSVIVVGSTLSVFPAAYIPLKVVEAGHPMVIINQGETEFDALATVTVDSPAGRALPPIVAELIRRPH